LKSSSLPRPPLPPPPPPPERSQQQRAVVAIAAAARFVLDSQAPNRSDHGRLGIMPAKRRYSALAIALHWLTALAMIANIIGGLTLGWFLGSSDSALKAQGQINLGLHKSLGLAIIIVIIFRLGWRLANPPPALPVHMTRLERRLAQISHATFYGPMVVLPLSGWALASTRRAAIGWFGLFDVPHLPIAASQRGLLGEGHELLGQTMVALVALHLFAAIRHQVFDREMPSAECCPPFPSARHYQLSRL